MLSNGPKLGLLVDGEIGEEHYDELMAQWRGLDALVQCTVISATTTAEPGSPADGDLYLVPTGATGTDWAGEDGKLARYSGVLPGWEFFTPLEGWLLYVLDTDVLGCWTGSALLAIRKKAVLELSSEYAGSVATTDDTPTTIITIPLATAGAVIMIETNVIGKDATPDLTSFRQTGSFKNVGGTVSQVGATTEVHAHADAGLNTASVDYAISGTNILVQVTGISATNITWKGRAVTTEN